MKKVLIASVCAALVAALGSGACSSSSSGSTRGGTGGTVGGDGTGGAVGDADSGTGTGGSGETSVCATVTDSALQVSCPNDSREARIQECEEDLAGVTGCDAQLAAAASCVSTLTAANYTCDVYGESGLLPPACENQVVAVNRCLGAGTTTLCEDELTYLPVVAICDGEVDCLDGSDEAICDESMVWFCDNGVGAVPVSWVCDFEEDCPDGSDEVGCD